MKAKKMKKMASSESHPHFQSFSPVVPSLFAPDTSFMEDNFSMVIYNEIIIRLSIMQNQGEP